VYDAQVEAFGPGGLGYAKFSGAEGTLLGRELRRLLAAEQDGAGGSTQAAAAARAALAQEHRVDPKAVSGWFSRARAKGKERGDGGAAARPPPPNPDVLIALGRFQRAAEQRPEAAQLPPLTGACQASVTRVVCADPAARARGVTRGLPSFRRRRRAARRGGARVPLAARQGAVRHQPEAAAVRAGVARAAARGSGHGGPRGRRRRRRCRRRR
jgi:hypothetical protein